MPLMGSLYIGQSGLQTSQNALNTTAHNMSNLDTTGYTRQQVLQGDKEYNTINRNVSAVSNQQIGLGVTYSKVRHGPPADGRVFLPDLVVHHPGRCMAVHLPQRLQYDGFLDRVSFHL